MAARAMWKAVVVFGKEKVPVKLYSALQDRNVHFRLLDAKDDAPIKQVMVNPETEETVASDQVKRGVISNDGDVVLLDEDELAALEPEPSREIQVLHYVPSGAIDRRFYRRPYYLGPDGAESLYAALVQALVQTGREGIVKWVMRKKSYVGTLRVYQGYLLLVTLRNADEVVPLDTIRTPKGSEPNESEVQMSQQLIQILAADFQPEQYHDEYRERVLQLIERIIAGGRKVTRLRKRPTAKPQEDLTDVLKASLNQEKRHARRR